MSDKLHIREGYFVIADVSGYTSFLTGTEFEHAQAIVEELTKLILDHVRPPMKVVKLEGDAVFYYLPGEFLPEAERLLDHIETCYFDFISHIQDMKHLTTCRCQACTSMHTLDLKFLAHYGEYVVQKVAGTAEDIAGRDVILLHRLLKNSVTERTGLRGYALLTDACLDRTGRPSSIAPHAETYDHFGEVKCGVHDLRAVERTRRESRRDFVAPEEADIIYERVVRATPEVLWSFNIDPERRLQWQNIRSVKNTRNSLGRLGAGAETHCAHGSFNRISRILDWRPFHYLTIQCDHKPAWKAPPSRITFELTPVDAERTRMSFSLRSLRRDWLTVRLTRTLGRRSVEKEFDAEYERLDRILAEMSQGAAARSG